MITIVVPPSYYREAIQYVDSRYSARDAIDLLLRSIGHWVYRLDAPELECVDPFEDSDPSEALIIAAELSDNRDAPDCPACGRPTYLDSNKNDGEVIVWFCGYCCWPGLVQMRQT